MLNITHDTGKFLTALIEIKNARKILEIDTSNGYSTLWLANPCQRTGGHVITVELSDYKYMLAKENFEQSDLSSLINQVQGDAGRFLSKTHDASFDFIFLDSERSQYYSWWPDIKRVLNKGGVLVVDNAISHSEEIKTLRNIIDQDSEFTTSLVPVGKGEFLAVKHG